MDQRALANAGEVLGRLDPAVLFTDVDGTLVGRDGSLFADLDGAPTLAAAEALVAAKAAGIEVVLVSGRNETQLREATRLLGLRDAIGELGTVLVLGRRFEILWGETPRELGATPHQALERSGAIALVLTAFAPSIEPHGPWHHGRVGTALLRGRVEPAEVEAVLAAAGMGWVRLLDNGRLRGEYPPPPARARAAVRACRGRSSSPPRTPARASPKRSMRSSLTARRLHSLGTAG